MWDTLSFFTFEILRMASPLGDKVHFHSTPLGQPTFKF